MELLVLFAVVFIVMYLVIPLLKLAAVIYLGAIVLYSTVYSLYLFGAAVKANLNPYVLYQDNHPNAPKGVHRNYFFGPGLCQLRAVILTAFANLKQSRQKRNQWLQQHNQTQYLITKILLYIAFYLSSIGIMLCSTACCLTVSAFLALLMLLCMGVFFLFFSVLCLLDSLPQIVKSMQTRCPACKYRSLVPVFRCPRCNLPHRDLIPGPYGILHRRCACGTKLAATYLGGRSRYQAECARCGTELIGTGFRQYGIQLIGDVGNGKTTFMSAFWHEYREWLKTIPMLGYQVSPPEAFDKLEEIYQGGKSEHTNEDNANMYSILHRIPGKDPVQMAIYDIAGEVFDYADPQVEQLQFGYCEGYVIVADATADADVLSRVIERFILRMETISGQHASAVQKSPVAVILTKSDRCQAKLGLPAVNAAWKAAAASGLSAEDYDGTRNRICRDYLLQMGCQNAVNLIESKFEAVSYFPVSAMGHEEGNGAFAPWGVLAPVFWLMRNKNCPLHTIFRNP